jgi:hypothetical protein
MDIPFGLEILKSEYWIEETKASFFKPRLIPVKTTRDFLLHTKSAGNFLKPASFSADKIWFLVYFGLKSNQGTWRNQCRHLKIAI